MKEKVEYFYCGISPETRTKQNKNMIRLAQSSAKKRIPYNAKPEFLPFHLSFNRFICFRQNKLVPHLVSDLHTEL